MENASKALIMAGTVLVGVLILSIAVYLFSTFAQYSSDSYKKIEASQIAEFNTQFLKYYGTTINGETDKEEVIKCTAHDIITLANIAQQSNNYYELQDLSEYNQNTNYIQVTLKNNKRNFKNIEKWTNDEKIDFIKENSINSDNTVKYYYISEVIISSATKRVCYIEFKDIIKIP